MHVTRGLKPVLLSSAVVGATVALASPASAEQLAGTYNALFSGQNGSSTTQTWILTPCGPDCSRLDNGTSVNELRLQGNTWSYSDADQCMTSIDSVTLTGTAGCSFMTFPFQLTKIG